MKKYLSERKDTMFLILFTIMGITLISVTYVWSIIKGLTFSNNQLGFDISVYGNMYSTFCINTLILYTYIKISKLQKYKNQRKFEKFIGLDKIDNIVLPKNCITNTVEINKEAQYVKYDIYFEKYERCIHKIVVLNIVVCIGGVIPYILFHAAGRNIIILIIQILVGIFNILFFVLSEMEHNEVKFCLCKLNQYKEKCEEIINEKYSEFMTFHIQNESIETYGNQPYYIIQYSKINNWYRAIAEFLIAIGGLLIVVYTIQYGLIKCFTEKNGLYMTLYPNILLIAFCMLSNQQYYNKIHQHKVVINDFSSKEIEKCTNREIKKLFYQYDMINKKDMVKQSFLISILDMTETKAMMNYSKVRIKQK